MFTTSPARTAPITRTQEDLWQWAERREAFPIVANRKKTLLSRTLPGPRQISRALSWCRKVLKSPARH